MSEKLYIFVVDTNSYAGNFNREMCAYMTGMWDNETHGGEQAEIFESEVGFDAFSELVNPQVDEYGLLSPQRLEQTPPSNKYNSVGIFLNDVPSQPEIELLKSRAKKFAKEGMIFDRPVKNLRVKGFRLLTEEITTTTTPI